MRELRERLGQAKNAATIGRAVIDEVRSRVGASACLFLPLADGGQDLSSAVACSDELPERDLLARATEMAPRTMRDFGTLEQHLARECKTVDFHRLLGRERLERLETYNAFWRPCRIERQVVGFMGEPQDPLGFVCMARRASDRAFTVADTLVLERVRRAAERALLRLRREASRPGGLGVMLEALETGLPLACALFDPDGRLLWISRQALARFEAEAPRLGRARILFDGCAEFASWRRAALESARDRSAASDEPHLRVEAPGGLHPVSVRRLSPPRGQPVVLVSALTPSHAIPASSGPDDLRSFRLTEREAEVVMLAARGFSVLNVAARLSIAESTVRTHVKNAYRKMRVSNRAELTSRVLGAVVGLTGPGGAPEAERTGEPLERSPDGR